MGHTPGPWSVNAPPSNRLRIATTVLIDQDITAAGWGGAVSKVKEARANARLIAAAPELLQMLETVEPIVRKHGEPYTHDFLLAAIAKARGEEA